MKAFAHLCSAVAVLGLLLSLVAACGDNAVPPTSSTIVQSATATPTAVAASQPATATTAPPVPTATMAPPAPTGTPAPTDRIIYLGADGASIMSIRPNGANPQTIRVIEKQPSEMVVDLSPDPRGEYILYGLTTDRYGFTAPTHYLLHGGVVTSLSQVFETPRWAPDGRSFVAGSISASGERGAIYLYDVLGNQGRQLLTSGVADWFSDSKRLIFARDGNVFTYDLATDTVTQLTALPNDESNKWAVEAVHVLPNGSGVIFFGGLVIANGASVQGPHGEGMQWWWLPLGGGKPHVWSGSTPDIRSGFDYAASPRGDRVAYVENAFGGAICPNIEQLTAVEIAGAKPLRAPGLGLDEALSEMRLVQSLSWSPAGDQLAFSIKRMACDDEDGTKPVSEPPTVFIWQPGPAGTDQPPAKKLEVGSEPVWIGAK